MHVEEFMGPFNQNNFVRDEYNSTEITSPSTHCKKSISTKKWKKHLQDSLRSKNNRTIVNKTIHMDENESSLGGHRLTHEFQ
jgi:hypothetical protein